MTIGGIYTNSTETVTQAGDWHEGKKHSLFVESDSSGGKSEVIYENDTFVGGTAYKRPRNTSLFNNRQKKRLFKVKGKSKSRI